MQSNNLIMTDDLEKEIMKKDRTERELSKREERRLFEDKVETRRQKEVDFYFGLLKKV